MLVNLGVTFAWIFFRAHTFSELKGFLSVLVGAHWQFSVMRLCAGIGPMSFAVCLLSILLLALSYLLPRDCAIKSIWGRFAFTLACACVVVLLGVPASGEFIYFKF